MSKLNGLPLSSAKLQDSKQPHSVQRTRTHDCLSEGGALCYWMNNNLKTSDALSHTVSHFSCIFLAPFLDVHFFFFFFASPVFVFESRQHWLTATLTAHWKYVTETQRMLTKHIFGMTSIKHVLFVLSLRYFPSPLLRPCCTHLIRCAWREEVRRLL